MTPPSEDDGPMAVAAFVVVACFVLVVVVVMVAIWYA